MPCRPCPGLNTSAVHTFKCCARDDVSCVPLSIDVDIGMVSVGEEFLTLVFGMRG